MLPQFQHFGKTSVFLLEENGWFGFLDPSISESERAETLNGLLSETEDARALASLNIVDEGEAETFQREADEWHESLTRLKAHTSRTTQENLIEYIHVLSLIEQRYRQRPTYPSNQILREHCQHLHQIMLELQEGSHDDDFTGSLLNSLRKDLSERVLLEYCDHEECGKAHGKFTNAFQKHFGIKIDRSENLGVGLALYLDRENHNMLRDEEQQTPRALNSFAEEQEYILLRRGLDTDIQYGSYPTPTSRWLFTYNPRPDNDMGSLEVVSKDNYGPITL